MGVVKPRGKESRDLLASQLQEEGLAPLLAFCETLDANPVVLLRWVVEGRPTARGRVFLDAIVTANGWLTSAGAVEQFRDAIAAGAEPRLRPSSRRSPQQRERIPLRM